MKPTLLPNRVTVLFAIAQRLLEIFRSMPVPPDRELVVWLYTATLLQEAARVIRSRAGRQWMKEGPK